MSHRRNTTGIRTGSVGQLDEGTGDRRRIMIVSLSPFQYIVPLGQGGKTPPTPPTSDSLIVCQPSFPRVPLKDVFGSDRLPFRVVLVPSLRPVPRPFRYPSEKRETDENETILRQYHSRHPRSLSLSRPTTCLSPRPGSGPLFPVRGDPRKDFSLSVMSGT